MPQENTSQDKILYQIKQSGPQSVKSLATALNVTTMGIRQHIAQLEEAGLITALPEVAQPRGRPLKPWKLTGLGHKRFPDSHAQVTVDLIASVRDVLGESALDKIIQNRTEETTRHYQAALSKSKSLSAKVTQLARLRTEEGYMAEVVKDGKDFILLEHHCPICVAAESCQGFCQSELEVFRLLLADIAQVNREDHIMLGAGRCSYRIKALA